MPMDGIICIDKPQEFTSFDVVAKMRGITKTRKIGHAGTLDPMATGVLPLFFGRGTKACDILPRQDKCYLAWFQLGYTTDTQDITGTVTGRWPVDCTLEQVVDTAAQFTGDIMQVPPMYSAVKIDGQKLYRLARQGVEVKRPARPVTIHSLNVSPVDPAEHCYQMEVHCSKGTYIRALVDDLGKKLGCGATLTRLRRTMAAGFTLEQCITLERAQELSDHGQLGSVMLPIKEAFASLPCAHLTDVQTKMVLNGIILDADRVDCPDTKEMLAVYTQSGVFLGTAAVNEGNFKMTKLFTLTV